MRFLSANHTCDLRLQNYKIILTLQNIFRFSRYKNKTTIMREVTINIPNTDFSFFQRLVQGFGWKYTEHVSTPSDSKEEVLSSLDHAFAEFRQMQLNGKKGRRAEELIDGKNC